MISKAAATLLPVAAMVFGASMSAAAPADHGADRVRVIVAYKDGQRAAAARALAMAGAEVHYDFAAQRGYAVSLPAVSIEGLSRNPAIDYVEEDVKRYPLAYQTGETVPYGVPKVQADVVSDSGTGNVRVCIIDSGLDTSHPDHAGNKVTGWTDSGTGDWFKDENHHGTHVAGTIAALNNGKGVVGVAPNGNLNLYIVKVFGADGWAYSSTLVDALNRCSTGKAASTKLIVSMSLGGTLKSRFEDSAFANAYSAGTLSIAAAGNDGNSRISYPAGYASVISVAAIDQSNAVASFSQYNSDVELAAPGVGVLSTVPVGTGRDSSLTVGTPYASTPMDGSVVGTQTGPLVDCGLGTAPCPAAPNSATTICLIQRGTNTFAEKVASCEAGGGKAAIIYNNVAGMLYGTLGGVATKIPSVGVSDTDGAALKAKATANASATVAVSATDYAYFDGTSMATPHVSGVAALVWGEKNTCTNAQIRSALASSATDLGAAGRDVYYGYGLVQAQAALTKLGTNCGGSSGGGGGGKPGKP